MERIEGLSIGLNLDSLKVESGLTDLRSALRQVNSEMKANLSVFDRSDRSIAKHETRLEGLNKKLQVQERIVDKARISYEKMVAEHGEGSREAQKAATQYNNQSAALQNLERSIDGVAKELKDLRKEQEVASSSWSQMGDSANQYGDRLKSIGRNTREVGRFTSLYVGAPLAGAFTLGIKTSMDFEAQMSRVGAIAGATSEEFKELRQSALDLGASTSKSASEVAIAQEGLAALGFTATDIISAMPGVISAAEASGADMALTADVVASALNIWGLEAGEASRVADILAQSANDTAADILDMQYAFKYAGAPAAALGVSMEETAAAIGLMTNAGLQGENAGTALRASLLALLKPSEANSKIMEAMGIKVTDAEGNFIGISKVIENFKSSLEGQTKTQQAATIASLVGTEATSGFLALMEAGPEEIDKMTKSLENSEGASAEAAAKMKDNLKGAIEELGGAVETAGITLGNILTPAIRSLTENITGLVNKFNALSPSTQKFIAIAGITAAVLGPLITFIGLFSLALGSAMKVIAPLFKAIANAGGILKALRLAFVALMGPIGITVTVIAALVAGFTIAYKKSETFRNIVQAVRDAIVSAYQKIKEFLTTNPQFLAFLDSVRNGFAKAKDMIMQAFGVAMDFVREKIGQVKAFWDSDGQQLLQAFKNIWNGIMFVVQPVIDAIVAVVKWAFPYIKIIIETAFKIVLSVVKMVWTNIKGVINGALDVIMGVVKIFSGLFTGDFSKMWEGVKQMFSGAIQFIWNYIQLLFIGRIIKGVGGFVKAFGSSIASLWTAVRTAFSTAITWIWNFFKNRFTSMLNTGRSIFTSLRNFFSSIWNGIKNIFYDTVRAVFEFVKGRFTNMRNNTTATFTSLRDTARKIWLSIKDNIINPVKNAYNSVVRQFGNVRDKGLEIFRNMRDKAKGVFDNMVDAIKGLPKRMGDGLSNAAKNIAGGVKNVSKFLLEGLAKGVNGVGDGINWILNKVNAPKKLRIPEWNIPAYAKGTDGHPGGPAIVSDAKGRNKQELIRTPDGNMFLSPKKETLLNLPKGTSVLDGNSTANLLKSGIPAYKDGEGLLQKAWGGAKNLWGSVKKTATTIWDFAKDPLSLIKTAVSDFTNLGDVLQPAKGIAEGMISKATTGAKDWIKGLLEGGDDVKASGNPTADVKKWVTRAMEIAGVSGSNWLNGLSLIAMRESGGNPKAQNNWDINAMRGIPSKGLMQTIGPTFNAFKKSGYDDIFNPVHNILAAIGYIKTRYKTIGNVPGVKAVNQGRPYVGYETGGLIDRQQFAMVGEGDKDEVIIPLEQHRNRAESLFNYAAGRLGFTDMFSEIVEHGKTTAEGIKNQLNSIRKQSSLLQQVRLTLSRFGQSVTNAIKTLQGSNNTIMNAISSLSVALKKKDSSGYNGTYSKDSVLDNTIKTLMKSGGEAAKKYFTAVIEDGDWANDWLTHLPLYLRGNTKAAGINLAKEMSKNGYRGFATGGLVANRGLYQLAEEGHPEWIIPTNPARRTEAMKLLALAGKDIAGNKRPNQLPTPSGGSNDAAVDNTAEMLAVLKQILQLLLNTDFSVNIDGEPLIRKVFKYIDAIATSNVQSAERGRA